jgi:type IV pilus assembly protein PilV
MKPSRRAPSQQRGAMLLEALVAILICAFGLLGFAGMQARATSAEFESFQRSQALVLIEDMASRINANRANAGAYVTGGLIGAGAVASCAGLTGADLDLCEWGNLLRGSAETRGGVKVGAMFNARGCITRALAPATDGYVIAIAWQGITPTAAPASTCGQGDAAFPTESLRRVVSTSVCVGLLTGEAANRC